MGRMKKTRQTARVKRAWLDAGTVRRMRRDLAERRSETEGRRGTAVW